MKDQIWNVGRAEILDASQGAAFKKIKALRLFLSRWMFRDQR